jgi:phage terminase large subunit
LKKQGKTRLVPVKASEWTRFNEAYRSILLKNGAVPVNDVFYDHWGNTHAVNLYYGSYGSGKSVFIAEEKIRKCIEAPYFKCYYGRKIFDTVRGSVFDTIVDVIEFLQLDHRFRYSKAPTSSMIIECDNGNKFIPFGSDKPEKLKSIKDPTDIWCEEFDQFAQQDFALLFPRLRTIKAITQFDGSFNTDKVYDNHWIKWQLLGFPHPETKEVQEFDVPVNKVFANYTDNYFIDQDDYFNKLKLAAGGNLLLLNAIAKGQWGVIQNKNPWLYAFDFKKNVSIKPLQLIPALPVHLSFDFNVNPLTCIAGQHSKTYGPGSFVHILKEYSLKDMNIDELCKRVKSDFPYSVLTVTGDATGRARNAGYVSGSETMWTMIQKKLKLAGGQVLTPLSNPSWKNSRFLCNALMQNHPSYLIDPSCKTLINDCQIARPAETDKPEKEDVLYKEPGNSQYGMHVFDCFRYYNSTHFVNFVKSPFS